MRSPPRIAARRRRAATLTRLSRRICWNSDVAWSGAGAVAAAVSRALAHSADADAVASAALRGAEAGRRMGVGGAHVVPAPSVAARLALAIEIAPGPGDLKQRCNRLANTIGMGLSVTEAVPAALGAIIAADLEPQPAIEAIVNLGQDADSVATIAGAVGGAASGTAGLDRRLVQRVVATNRIDLRARVESLVTLPAYRAGQ